MATTAKSKTTKTKPAKKPATKPAGASIKPKQHKTVKTNKTPKTAKTNTKSTSTSTKPTKSNCRGCEIFFGIIMIVLALAMIAGAVSCLILQPWKNDTVIVESGKGNQIATTFINLPDSNAYILVPKSFKKLNDQEIEEFKKSESSEDTNIKVAYANEDKSALIYLTEAENETSDDDIKTSLNDLAKIFKEAGIKDIQTNVKDVEDHTVGTMKFSGLKTTTYPYQYIAFFSNNNKLASVAFTCKDNVADEWEKAGNTIIDSLTFKK